MSTKPTTVSSCQVPKSPTTYLACEVCLARRGAGKLMCLRCWRLVPPKLAMAVNRTWRSFNLASGADRLPALRKYREAREAAIAAVREQVTATTVPGEKQ